MISVCIQIPDAYRARAEYVFRELALRWCIPVHFDPEPERAYIHYTNEATPAQREALTIPFDANLYEPQTVCRAEVDDEGRWLWGPDERTSPASSDLIGSTYRLLTYLDESQIPSAARDPRGIFVKSALPPERKRAAMVPLVEHQADAILSRLLRLHPSVRRAQVPRWPHGKRYAIALSHDVDAAHVGAFPELATNLAKGVLRQSVDHLKLFGLGLRFVGRKSRNPYFAFSLWREWEAQRRAKSATYLYHRPARVSREINDCKSDVAGRGTDWSVLRAMADEGWEFGLHPSINVKDSPGGFRLAKEWLETKLERPVYGLRHHYWALDWFRPHATHRQHAEAGYLYDSSIAWRDKPGFRAGTALPYKPFDPEREREIKLLEIPCNLMDGHVLMDDGRRVPSATAVLNAKSLIAAVQACGGVITTNWHLHAGINKLVYREFLDVLQDALAPVLEDSDAWIATPVEICKHWEQLRIGLGAHPRPPQAVLAAPGHAAALAPLAARTNQ